MKKLSEMTKREKAKGIVWNYFTRLADAAGENYGPHHREQLDLLVDCLIDAAKEEMRQELMEAVG